MRVYVDEGSRYWGTVTLFQMGVDTHQTVLEVITKADEAHIRPKLHVNGDDSAYCTTSLLSLRVL